MYSAQLIEFLTQHFTNLDPDGIQKKFIEMTFENYEPRENIYQPLEGIKSFYCFRVDLTQENTIFYRYATCYCSNCVSTNYSQCSNFDSRGIWKSHTH